MCRIKKEITKNEVADQICQLYFLVHILHPELALTEFNERDDGNCKCYLGRISSEDEKRVCYCEKRSQCEHIFKNFNCPTREIAK